jgi:hypothetical protein
MVASGKDFRAARIGLISLLPELLRLFSMTVRTTAGGACQDHRFGWSMRKGGRPRRRSRVRNPWELPAAAWPNSKMCVSSFSLATAERPSAVSARARGYLDLWSTRRVGSPTGCCWFRDATTYADPRHRAVGIHTLASHVCWYVVVSWPMISRGCQTRQCSHWVWLGPWSSCHAGQQECRARWLRSICTPQSQRTILVVRGPRLLSLPLIVGVIVRCWPRPVTVDMIGGVTNRVPLLRCRRR